MDSSKDPYRLGMVDAGGLAELHVVWLVRDPRGVVCSLTAPRGGSESPRATRRTRAALRWSVQQLLFDALARRMRRRATVTVVRYEDLATDPAATLARIAEAIGVDSTDFDVDGFRSHRHHAVATNPMVARDDPVVLDESWRGAPRTALALTWLVCGLPARRFGYRWSGPLAPSRVRGSAGPRVAR